MSAGTPNLAFTLVSVSSAISRSQRGRIGGPGGLVSAADHASVHTPRGGAFHADACSVAYVRITVSARARGYSPSSGGNEAPCLPRSSRTRTKRPPHMRAKCTVANRPRGSSACDGGFARSFV
jgi:hypothetical protein